MPTADRRLLEFAQESGQYPYEERSKWTAAPPPSYESSAAEHAARIVALALADEGYERRVA